MSLSSISIRRPVLAWVIAIAIILFGVIGVTFLGVREYPNVDPPIITVSTTYIGASADVIESQITEPLEESISGIAGIRTLSSVSREGRSTITVEFNLNVDLETAANDVRDKVSRGIRNLPPDVENPIVSKADANAVPIVFLNIKSKDRNLLELTDIANNTFKERLQTISDVSRVSIWGEKRYSMRLWMDPQKLVAYQVTPLDIRNALARENVELPSGRIEGEFVELTVRTAGRLVTVDEFNDMIIREEGDRIIRFRDVGHAELGPENLRTLLKRDGIPMVGLVLIPQPGANYISILDEFYKRVDQIKKDLPQDIKLGIGFDSTTFIRAAIKEVLQTIIIAFLLVVAVIFLFLRDWRTTLIPVLTIPIALIGSFFIMYIAGFSINVLTLLGIVLAIGLVVDDAIVMLENVYAKIEQGMDPISAGFKGSREVYFAIISTTIALVAVFMPIIFLQGITGRLFKEFGIVVASAVVISSFVALSLTPMLASRLLKRGQKHNRFYQKTEPFFNRLTKKYTSLLISFMNRRWLAWTVIAVSLVMVVGFGVMLPQELAPLEDRSGMFIFSSGPEGTTFEYMDYYMDQMIRTIQEAVPETQALISVTSPGFSASGSVNSGFMRLILTPPEERERSQQEIAGQVTGLMRGMTGIRAFVRQEESIGQRSFGLPVQYVIQAPNFERLKEVLPSFVSKAAQDPTFVFSDVDLKFNKPELRIDINRDKARSLGISVRDIAETLQLSLAGQRFGFFIMNGKQYQVIGQLMRTDRNEPFDLKNLFVRNKHGQMIPLDNVVMLSEQSSPPQRYRFNRYVSATVSAALAPGKTLSDGIAAMDAIADQVLDDSFSTSLAGSARDFSESSSSLLFAFGLALILIYLVLSAQFESFRDPWVIMFTVPLALAGALFALWYFDQTINIFSQIGQIMLIGLVTKNGILLVEFANQRRQQGLSVTEAIQDAARTRFRPILMTTLSTVLGILPIALALGAGAQSRSSLGIAVIGGLIFSGFLTLFIIPVIYTYFARKSMHRVSEKSIEHHEPLIESETRTL